MLLTNLFLNAILLPFASSGDQISSSDLSNVDKAAKGSAIMEKVFHRFHINYEMERTHKIGYYQEAMEDEESVHYLAESILDIYVPSNLNEEAHASVKPIRARKKSFKDVTDESLLFGNASDMARCSIWRPNSFLGEKKRDNYAFSYKKDSLFHRIPVNVVEFYPANSKGEVHGTILVDKRNFAVLHIDYTPDATNSKLWNQVTWTEEFMYKEGA